MHFYITILLSICQTPEYFLRSQSGVKLKRVRMNKKIGRNDPCSCGSGKKYKQCCLKREQVDRTKKDIKMRSIKSLTGGITNMMSNIGDLNKKLTEEKKESVTPPDSSETLES